MLQLLKDLQGGPNRSLCCNFRSCLLRHHVDSITVVADVVDSTSASIEELEMTQSGSQASSISNGQESE
jgi:hypothetical protein